MKGDFTRMTFDSRKHYNRVLMQQGRVQLDADWNEQLDIDAHRVETETIDTLSACGTPLEQSGFAVVVEPTGLPAAEQTRLTTLGLLPLKPGNFLIGPGRYYVDGKLCENEDYALYTMQPDLPGDDPTKPPSQPELEIPPITTSGLYLAYLDVWDRHLTALDDKLIREKALGGPDTATRAKTIWQVKQKKLDASTYNCATAPQPKDESTGKLSARAKPEEKLADDCDVPPGAGYRRLENQLYRVEIHKDGDESTATFKWSRDNGSMATTWKSKNGNVLTVETLGPDQVLGFQPGQWIELTDDTRELQGKRGTLVKLVNPVGPNLTIDPATATGPVEYNFFPLNPKVRRWDTIATKDGIRKVNDSDTVDNFIRLEDGIELKFEKGNYNTGDYWLIPARTADADVEWQKDASNNPIPQSKHGIHHHYCKLGLLKFDSATKKLDLTEDCRSKFPQLTDLMCLYYVSGDGQEGMSNGVLPYELAVGVSNGNVPVSGARVKFSVLHGGGTLSVAQPMVTDAQGLARCQWTLGSAGNQQVMAELIDSDGKRVHIPVIFDALVVISAVSGGLCTITVGDGIVSFGDYDKADGLQQAINQACDQGGGTICVLRGNYLIESTIVGKGCQNLVIQGNRLETRLESVPGVLPMRFIECQGVELYDLIVEATDPVSDLIAGLVTFERCDGVIMEGCLVRGSGIRMYKVACLLVVESSPPFASVPTVSIRDCQFDAGGRGQIHGVLLRRVLEANVSDNLIRIFTMTGGYGIDLDDDCDACLVAGNKITGIPTTDVTDVGGSLGGIHLGSGCDHVTVRENWIDGGSGFGIGLGSVDENATSLGGIRGLTIEHNVIQNMALSGIGFLPFGATDKGQPVTDDLLIRSNRIGHCAFGKASPVIPPFFPAPLRMAGGVVLWMGENIRVVDNDIFENGHSDQIEAPHPVCGVGVVFPGPGLTLSDNRIIRNFSTVTEDPDKIPVASGGIYLDNGVGTGKEPLAIMVLDNEVVSPRGSALLCVDPNTAVQIADNRLIGASVAAVVEVLGHTVQFNGNNVVSRSEGSLGAGVLIRAQHTTFNANHCLRMMKITSALNHVVIDGLTTGSASATGNHCLETGSYPHSTSLRIRGHKGAITAVANVTTNGVILSPPDPAANLANLVGVTP